MGVNNTNYGVLWLCRIISTVGVYSLLCFNYFEILGEFLVLLDSSYMNLNYRHSLLQLLHLSLEVRGHF